MSHRGPRPGPARVDKAFAALDDRVKELADIYLANVALGGREVAYVDLVRYLTELHPTAVAGVAAAAIDKIATSRGTEGA